MSRWFRLDDDVINDPKILLLPEAMRWIWVAFLCIASKNNGVMPSIEIIALSLRVKASKAAEYLTRLVVAGLIDKTETGFEPHNWAGRQYKSDVTDPTAASRQKAYRERNKNRNGDRNASVMNTDTREQITDTEAEKIKKTREVALVDDGWPADYREQFWQAFPNKVGKPKALAKLDACRKRGIVFAHLMGGLERYIRTKPPDRAWLNPETFLNQERWTDQPAPTQQGNPNGRRTVQDAANDLIQRLGELDAPAPGGICGPESEGSIRLLPPR